MKKTLLILGVGVVIGAVTYAVLQGMKKQKATTVDNSDNKQADNQATDPVPTPTQGVSIDDMETARKSAEDSITERHEEAAQIIKDAVEVILKRIEAPETELEELDQIASGLDDLLSEG